MKKGTILLVDDDEEIREIVNVLLSSEGYTVYPAADGAQALALIETYKDEMDLVVLDVMMPQLDGYDVCKKIRQISHVPVLFLTAKNRETDLVEGYLCGGDDYMQKPFSYTELIARVGGLIRRYRRYGSSETEAAGEQVNVSDITIDKKQMSVKRGGRELDLTNTEYGILLLLSENRGRVFSLQQIYEAVWQDTFLTSSSNTVMVHIRNLREKLRTDESGEELIKNKWGRGYYID